MPNPPEGPASSPVGGRIGVSPPPPGVEWFGDNGCTYPVYSASTPPAIYDPVDSKTWLAYEAWDFTNRLLVVSTYDHSSAEWAGPYTAITSPMVDDDHGVPVLCMDDNGYVGITGGSHDGDPCLFASTTNPRDPTSWSSTTNLKTGTYSHQFFVGGARYIFLRGAESLNPRLFMHQSTSITNGVPVFAAAVPIGDFGANTRWYQGSGAVVGNDIHMTAIRANPGTVIAQDVYYLIYDTLTGGVRNFDGSMVVSAASLPVNRATLDAHFRIVDQTTGGTQGWIPQLVIVDGVYHIAYKDGVDTTFHLYHICNDGSGWTLPLEIGAFPNNNNMHKFDMFTITASAVLGDVDLWWPATFGDFTRGGKIVKRTRHVNGTLGTQVDVKTPDRQFALDPVVAVKGGHPAIRVILTEASEPPSAEQQLRVYAAGDNGIVHRPA